MRARRILLCATAVAAITTPSIAAASPHHAAVAHISQRQKVYKVQTDLGNLAAAEESYLSKHGTYGTKAEMVKSGKFKATAHVTTKIAWYDTYKGYCISGHYGTETKTTTNYYYSEKGGLKGQHWAGCQSVRPKGAKNG